MQFSIISNSLHRENKINDIYFVTFKTKRIQVHTYICPFGHKFYVNFSSLDYTMADDLRNRFKWIYIERKRCLHMLYYNGDYERTRKKKH